jgi:hypothetical protein
MILLLTFLSYNQIPLYKPLRGFGPKSDLEVYDGIFNHTKTIDV